MKASTTATYNTALGTEALKAQTTGVSNTAVGYYSLVASTTGACNVAVGVQAGDSVTDGLANTLIGSFAGKDLAAGGGNVVVGSLKPDGAYSPPYNLGSSDNNRIVLGSTTSTNAYIQIDWTVTSDLRDKPNIETVPHGLTFINQITPIKYNFKTSREDETINGSKKYGFSAQEILALEGDNPIIVDNEDTNNLKMTNAHLIPVLVNAIKELKAEIDELKNN